MIEFRFRPGQCVTRNSTTKNTVVDFFDSHMLVCVRALYQKLTVGGGRFREIFNYFSVLGRKDEKIRDIIKFPEPRELKNTFNPNPHGRGRICPHSF
jgi:hypothetical protein